MRRARNEWWQTRFTGHSTTQMYVVVETLDGEWKEKGLQHPLPWKEFSIWYDTKQYFKRITPWSTNR